jgi:hypothetical protein
MGVYIFLFTPVTLRSDFVGSTWVGGSEAGH